MKQKENTRQKLIMAARAELESGNGYLEMQGVAKRAGTSVGLAYHHFSSKAGLIAAVVEDFYAPMMEPDFGVADLENASWEEREKARAKACIDYYFDVPFARLIVGPLGRTAEVMDVDAAFMEIQLSEGARNLRAAQKAGDISGDLDPDIAIALIHGGLHQVIAETLKKEDKPDRAFVVEQIWTFFASAVGADNNRRNGKTSTEGNCD